MARKIKNIGRQECKELEPEMISALQRTLNKYGLEVEYKKAGYAGATADFTFTIKTAEAEAQANKDGELLGAEFNVGDIFKSNGEEFEVTGFNFRRRKYPVSATKVATGKRYKFGVEQINMWFKFNQPKEEVTA